MATLSEKELKLGEIYNTLSEIKAKHAFLNSANMSMSNDLLAGNSSIDANEVYGRDKIAMEIEVEFELVLEQLQKFEI